MKIIQGNNQSFYAPFEGDPGLVRSSFCLSNPLELEGKPEDAGLLQKQPDLNQSLPQNIQRALQTGQIMAVNTALAYDFQNPQHNLLFTLPSAQGLTLHLAGLGDVGGTMLIGLRLLAGSKLAKIGIYDKDPQRLQRYEMEINQIFSSELDMPEVVVLNEEEIFDCHIFAFTVAAAVPPLGTTGVDVRMIQLEKNSAIISHYAKLARKSRFSGLFAVISDPVDQLCKAAFDGSNTNDSGIMDYQGLRSDQIRGFGLGVMNARALYYAKKLFPKSNYAQEGRAFGPHGRGLVIANSIPHYDEDISNELTELTVTANLKVRETGYKPYIAPAMSSAAISLLQAISGQWHYSSTFAGGIFLGARNRLTLSGTQLETHPDISPQLINKIQNTMDALK